MSSGLLYICLRCWTALSKPWEVCPGCGRPARDSANYWQEVREPDHLTRVPDENPADAGKGGAS